MNHKAGKNGPRAFLNSLVVAFRVPLRAVRAVLCPERGPLAPFLCAIVLTVGVSWTCDARAEDPVADSARRDEAEQRYKRALELFNEGSYDASLLEFQRAYELLPSYRLLYNVALVNIQVNDYAGALDAFERFLAEGDDKISKKRRNEVEKHIRDLQSKVGFVEVTVSEAGAEVFVDEVSMGMSPLSQPLRVNVGRRQITTIFLGESKTKIAEITGEDRVQIAFEMAGAQPADIGGESETKVQPVERQSRTPMYVTWGLTGALAASAVTAGVLALGAKSRQVKEKERLGTTSEELDRAQGRVRTMALVTDVLGAAAVVSAGAAIYFTVKTSRKKPQEEVSLVLGSKGAFLHGSF